MKFYLLNTYLSIYLGSSVAFKTVQIISRRVVGRTKESRFIQLVKVMYCKLLTNSKQLPAFPLESGWDSNSDLRGTF